MSFKKVNELDDTSVEGKKSILVYGFNEEELIKVKKFTGEMKIEEIIYVDKNMVQNTLGDLALGNGKVSNVFNNPVIIEKVVVFSNLSDKNIYDYVNGFKKEIGIRPIFASITVHSIKWKFYDLIQELIKEKEEMKKISPK
ncbi:DUF3783 domain-containing protein [Clostridium grantii]|uniref:DUF3783 domain-containing protein n=1 Tax=Clostridium grantii DSM 8605 TaxID=1121316 RepID=A0A1M5X355_9CLOT|nr:DUF3783 domain-containing protein [Clostridium grantii]SHH94221.1 protein of unknown function [Clostridium grantii DSM 8605]